MRLLLRAVGALMQGAYAVLSRFVDPRRLDDVVVLHWCHHYIRHGMARPPFIGMDNPPNPPTTNAATDVEATTFTANASYTGGINIPDITERGFCWIQGTTGDPTTANNTNFETGSWAGSADFDFSRPFTGMTAGTSYRVRAYVVNSIGTSLANNTVTVTTTSDNRTGTVDASEGPDTSAVVGTVEGPQFPGTVDVVEGPDTAAVAGTSVADLQVALAPTLLTPADMAEADGTYFTWEFNSDNEESQAAFAFRRGGEGSYEWWNGTGWQSTEVFIESPNEFLSLPSGAWD